MINFLNSKNRIQNIQPVQQVSAVQSISKNNKEIPQLTDVVPLFSMKALTSQIEAMAEQDNLSSIGKKLNLFA